MRCEIVTSRMSNPYLKKKKGYATIKYDKSSIYLSFTAVDY